MGIKTILIFNLYKYACVGKLIQLESSFTNKDSKQNSSITLKRKSHDEFENVLFVERIADGAFIIILKHHFLNCIKLKLVIVVKAFLSLSCGFSIRWTHLLITFVLVFDMLLKIYELSIELCWNKTPTIYYSNFFQ